MNRNFKTNNVFPAKPMLAPLLPSFTSLARTGRVLSLFAVLAFLLVTGALAVPPNDNIANATVLTGDSATATADNTQATVEAGDFAYHTLLWKWTAPANGRVAIDTNNRVCPDVELIVYLQEVGKHSHRRKSALNRSRLK